MNITGCQLQDQSSGLISFSTAAVVTMAAPAMIYVAAKALDALCRTEVGRKGAAYFKFLSEMSNYKRVRRVGKNDYWSARRSLSQIS